MSTLKILIILTVLMISWPLSAEEKSEYLLIVDISKRNLTIYLTEDGETEIASYLIAVPKNDWLPLPLIGEVKKTELNPLWYPTKKTRIAYLNKNGVELPEIIKPGDQKNAMGLAKIVVEFENFKTPIRIHGTNDPSSIGKRVSRGCIRMHNNQILELVEIIKGAKTKVIIY